MVDDYMSLFFVVLLSCLPVFPSFLSVAGFTSIAHHCEPPLCRWAPLSTVPRSVGVAFARPMEKWLHLPLQICPWGFGL